MSELELYKYLFDEEDGLNPEMRWSNDELLIFLYYFQLEDFMKDVIEPSGITEDGGFEAHLKDRYLVIDLVPVLECFDIEPTNILAKKS